jgi:hypothetical protein
VASGPARTRPLVLGLVLLFGISTLVAGMFSFANAVPGNLDDAFITLVYARHLFEDHALYWNLQDGHIDGFTSLLHVLILAAAWPFADDPVVLARELSLWVHLLGGIACLAILSGIGTDSGRAIAAAGLAALALSLHPAPAHGASFLLESPIFVLLALGGAALPLRIDLVTHALARRAWMVVLVLLCLVRPEGQAIAVLLAAVHAGIAPREADRRRWEPLIAIGTTLVIYYAWHWLYFDALLPNTYYAKSSASRSLEIAEGAAYLHAFATAQGLLGWLTLALPGLVLLPLFMTWPTATGRARHVGVAMAALGALLMVIWEGGDSYDGGRFLAVPTALGLVGCAHLVSNGPTLARRGAWVVLGALAILAAVQQLGAFARGGSGSVISTSIDDYACERQAARELARVALGSEVMQTDWQRLLFFEDELHVIDLHGLNDREIARLSWSGPVRYGKFSYDQALEVGAPVWIYGYRLTSDVPMAAVPIDQLLRNPQVFEHFVGYGAPAEVVDGIAAAYVPASFPVCGKFFNVLVRRDHAESFVRQGVLVGPR